MKKLWQDWLILAAIVVGSTFLVWAPFFFKWQSFWNMDLPNNGMQVVVSNFDGPHYIAVAKSLYQTEILESFEFDEPVEYYAAHFPLYPLLIRLFGTVVGYPYAMLGITVFFTVMASWMFYVFVKDLGLKHPLWLTILFLFLPARWMVVRTVGTPEPLFTFLILGSVLAFRKQQYWIAGLIGALAMWTKPPAILLFFAYGASLLYDWFADYVQQKPTEFGKQIKWLPWWGWPIGFIPVSLLLLWAWYGQLYGSFWAYFESGDNIHLFWPPFQVFNTAAAWVGTFWLEDIVWLLLIATGGVAVLWKRRDVLFWFAVIFLISTMFVSHRDLARYSLPMMPFLIVAYAPWLERKEFRVVFWVILLPVYLYTVNFIAGNTTPISDWGKLL